MSKGNRYNVNVGNLQLELDDVSILGRHLGRVVRQSAVLTDLDGDGLGHGDTERKESSEEGRETHGYFEGWIEGNERV